MGTAATLRHMSIEEYLDSESRAEVRHEYIGGEIFAMVGAPLHHERLVRGIWRAVDAHLRNTACEAFAGSARLRIEAADCFYYPDVFVCCVRLPNSMRYADDAILVVEVLSESTEAVDRREKRRNYALLPGLREYVLVAQDERRVEVFRKTDRGEWEIHVFAGEDDVRLASIDLTVPLAAIYREAGID